MIRAFFTVNIENPNATKAQIVENTQYTDSQLQIEEIDDETVLVIETEEIDLIQSKKSGESILENHLDAGESGVLLFYNDSTDWGKGWCYQYTDGGLQKVDVYNGEYGEYGNDVLNYFETEHNIIGYSPFRSRSKT